MARMRTGRRLTPQTTDPQGNRIADPDVVGKKINSNQTVSSWPKVREMYQSGQLNESFKGRAINPQVKSYLEGKTNKLDDKEFEEPVLSKMNNGLKEYSDLSTFYRKGGKNYSRVEKSVGKKPSTEGSMNYYDTGETAQNIKKWASSGGGGGVDLNRYRPKPGEFKPETKKPEPPKADDLTLDKMPIPKPGKIDIKKRTIKTREEAPAPEKFVNPPKPRSYKSAKSNLRNDHRILGVDYTAKVRTNIKTGRKKLVVDNVSLARKSAPKGYKREEKQFKAYAGQTATGDSFLDMTPKDIKAYRKEAKSIRAEYRKQPDSDTKAMGKAAMTSEIRQSRKAEKFSKKVYDFKGKGGVKFFNDKNYGGDIIKDYRASEDNANNRNNMANKLKAIGDKTSKRRAELEKSKTGGFQYNQVNQ